MGTKLENVYFVVAVESEKASIGIQMRDNLALEYYPHRSSQCSILSMWADRESAESELKRYRDTDAIDYKVPVHYNGPKYHTKQHFVVEASKIATFFLNNHYHWKRG